MFFFSATALRKRCHISFCEKSFISKPSLIQYGISYPVWNLILGRYVLFGADSLCAATPSLPGEGQGVRCRKLWRTPKGHRLESHTKTLTKDGVRRRSQLSPLPEIGEGFGEWSEVLLRTRRIRWL